MKKIVLLFLSVMMAFCLCACSGKGVSAGKAKKIIDDTCSVPQIVDTIKKID